MNAHENALLQAVLHYREAGEHENNWTRGVCRALAFHNFDELGYYNSQLMEPSLLIEVAREAGLTARQVASFEYATDGPASVVKWLAQMIEWATHIQRLNLASCLAATARYDLARSALERVDPDRLQSEQRYAYLMMKFIIDNRSSAARSHAAEFAAIREMIERAELPDGCILEAAAQAIVWQSKASSVGSELAAWFADRGLRTASALGQGKDFREHISISCFHRAHAMISADRRDAAATREEMRKAQHFAWIAQPKSKLAECKALDARKTVLESTLKEMLYVAADLDEAERVGGELIELDPEWSISYHEVAEVHLKRERYEDALALYRKARSIGLPRVTFSQYMIGSCLMVLGREEEALAAFADTLALDDTNISAGISGYRLARSTSHPSEAAFSAHLARWDEAGLLTPEHKELLA